MLRAASKYGFRLFALRARVGLAATLTVDNRNLVGLFASVGDKSMASALPFGDLSVRMRNHRHELNGANTQRPERIPIDSEHRSYSRSATAAVPIDSLLQNSRRREHDYAARRIRHLGAGLRIVADTLTFLDFSCHSSVPFSFRIADHPALGVSLSGIGRSLVVERRRE